MSRQPTHFLAVYLVFMKGEEVLLLRRANTGYQDGKYSLVAGHVEAGETTLKAAVREAKEEAGVDVKITDLDILHVSHRVTNKDYICIFAKVDRWSGEMINMEPEKCDELYWCDIEKPPENLVSEVAEFFDQMKLQNFYNEFSER